jgi:hypothetical protein
MRRGWKRVAERSDRPAFTPEEISEAIVPALAQDCRAEMRPEFLDALIETFRRQGSELFPDEIGPRLASMYENTHCGLERSLLENVQHCTQNGASGIDVLEAAALNALKDRGARGLRQVEEHYCRKSNQSRALRVRERIEAALGIADLKGFVRQLFGLESRSSLRNPAKHSGLDDGVRL